MYSQTISHRVLLTAMRTYLSKGVAVLVAIGISVGLDCDITDPGPNCVGLPVPVGPPLPVAKGPLMPELILSLGKLEKGGMPVGRPVGRSVGIPVGMPVETPDSGCGHPPWDPPRAAGTAAMSVGVRRAKSRAGSCILE